MNGKAKYQQGFIDYQLFLKNKILSMNLLFRFCSDNLVKMPEESESTSGF